MPGIRVVKVGGSLFALDDLPARLREWLKHEPRLSTILITGGGEWADGVRALDARAPGPPERAHWLAVRAMSLTAWILAQQASDWPYYECLDEMRHYMVSRGRATTVILDVFRFLHQTNPDGVGPRLTTGWQVTSDSIAACVAQRVEADELVLLKSTDTRADSLETARHQGLVDEEFSRVARWLPAVRCVNLRARPWISRSLTTTTDPR